MKCSPVASSGDPAATVQRTQGQWQTCRPILPRFQAERYNPAVLHLRPSAEGKTTSKQTDSFLDITLISAWQPEGVRAELSIPMISCGRLYRQLSRQRFNVIDPQSPSSQLHDVVVWRHCHNVLQTGLDCS